MDHGKNYQGELHIEEGRSIVITPRVPGDEQWRDATREPPSIKQKLDVEGFAMQVPNYLADMRGESRKSSLRALSTFGEVLSNHRRSVFVRSVLASTNIDTSQSIQVSNKYITLAPKARLSTVIVPVNAKQWLLQVLCQKDLQLRELFDQVHHLFMNHFFLYKIEISLEFLIISFYQYKGILMDMDQFYFINYSYIKTTWLLALKSSHVVFLYMIQMELVPQFAGDHIREVRATWQAQEDFHMPVPPEAETLIKDKSLLDKVRGLLIHFNEPIHNKSPEVALMEEENRSGDILLEDDKPKIEDFRTNKSIEKKNSHSHCPPKMFQVLPQSLKVSLYENRDPCIFVFCCLNQTIFFPI